MDKNRVNEIKEDIKEIETIIENCGEQRFYTFILSANSAKELKRALGHQLEMTNKGEVCSPVYGRVFNGIPISMIEGTITVNNSDYFRVNLNDLEAKIEKDGEELAWGHPSLESFLNAVGEVIEPRKEREIPPHHKGTFLEKMAELKLDDNIVSIVSKLIDLVPKDKWPDECVSTYPEYLRLDWIQYGATIIMSVDPEKTLDVVLYIKNIHELDIPPSAMDICLAIQDYLGFQSVGVVKGRDEEEYKNLNEELNAEFAKDTNIMIND